MVRRMLPCPRPPMRASSPSCGSEDQRSGMRRRYNCRATWTRHLPGPAGPAFPDAVLFGAPPESGVGDPRGPQRLLAVIGREKVSTTAPRPTSSTTGLWRLHGERGSAETAGGARLRPRRPSARWGRGTPPAPSRTPPRLPRFHPPGRRASAANRLPLERIHRAARPPSCRQFYTSHIRRLTWEPPASPPPWHAVRRTGVQRLRRFGLPVGAWVRQAADAYGPPGPPRIAGRNPVPPQSRNCRCRRIAAPRQPGASGPARLRLLSLRRRGHRRTYRRDHRKSRHALGRGLPSSSVVGWFRGPLLPSAHLRGQPPGAAGEAVRNGIACC